MPFTSGRVGADRSIELVRQSLLQGDSLPFSDALTTAQIEQAFDAEGIRFGDAPCEPNNASLDGGTVYTMGVTLWAMLSQALFAGVQRSCRADDARCRMDHRPVYNPLKNSTTDHTDGTDNANNKASQQSCSS